MAGFLPVSNVHVESTFDGDDVVSVQRLTHGAPMVLKCFVPVTWNASARCQKSEMLHEPRKMCFRCWTASHPVASLRPLEVWEVWDVLAKVDLQPLCCIIAWCHTGDQRHVLHHCVLGFRDLVQSYLSQRITINTWNWKMKTVIGTGEVQKVLKEILAMHKNLSKLSIQERRF